MRIVVNIGNKYYFIFMHCVHLHTSLNPYDDLMQSVEQLLLFLFYN